MTNLDIYERIVILYIQKEWPELSINEVLTHAYSEPFLEATVKDLSLKIKHDREQAIDRMEIEIKNINKGEQP